MCCELRFVTFERGTPSTQKTIVVLPDHLHCVWTLGPGDTDFFYPLESDQGTLLCYRKREAYFAKACQAG
jgi:hypothetical protein